MLSGILGEKPALAIPEADNERAARILAQDITVRTTLALERVLDRARQSLADRAEEAVSGSYDLVLIVSVFLARTRPAVVAAIIGLGGGAE